MVHPVAVRAEITDDVAVLLGAGGQFDVEFGAAEVGVADGDGALMGGDNVLDEG